MYIYILLLIRVFINIKLFYFSLLKICFTSLQPQSKVTTQLQCYDAHVIVPSLFYGYLKPCSLMKMYKVGSGSDDPDNLGHLDHFLVGQADLICKINYLDVTQFL